MTVREQHGRIGRTFLDALYEGADLLPAPDTRDLREYVERALRGGFPNPAVQIQGDPTRRAWLESYISDLLTHDVEQIEAPTTRRRCAKLGGHSTAYDDLRSCRAREGDCGGV